MNLTAGYGYFAAESSTKSQVGISGFPISLGSKIHPPLRMATFFLFTISFRASQLLLGILLGIWDKGKGGKSHHRKGGLLSGPPFPLIRLLFPQLRRGDVILG
jgi:hypothetical protein